jgi:hypothetical protein
MGADSSAGGAPSSPATAAEGSSPSQDRSVDFLQSTQVDCQSSKTTTSYTTREDPTLTSLNGLPSRSECRGYCDVHQSSLVGRLLLRLCGRCPFCSISSRCSALLRFCSHHFLRSSSCGLRALLTSRGAGAPSAPGALRQWGLGYDSQRPPPPCPTRLRHPDQRAP